MSTQVQDVKNLSYPEMADTISKALIKEPKNRYELNNVTGIPLPNLMSGIHYLLHACYPPRIAIIELKNDKPLNVSTGDKDRESKYYLTPDGRAIIEKKLHKEVPVGSSKPFANIRMAQKVGGTVRLLSDGSVQLGGVNGICYEYIKKHGTVTARDVIEAEGLSPGQVHAAFKELDIHKHLISYEERRNEATGRMTRYYTLLELPHTKIPTPPQQQQQPKAPEPQIIPAKTINELTKKADSLFEQKAPPADKPSADKPDLKKIMRELREHYDDDDIILEWLGEHLEELGQLRKLKNVFNSINSPS